MKRLFFSLYIVALLLTGCAEVRKHPVSERQALETETSQPVENGAGETILLFTIGMHIEPFGKTAQGYGGGKADYHNAVFFEKQVEDIKLVAQIIESHGGRMTVQAQSPFTEIAIESNNAILADLAEKHEIALHFHEDAHMGKNSSALEPLDWCNVLKEEISLITQASGVTEIRYWSGGNLYLQMYEAATCAGLDVNSDWKNPNIQETDLSLVGVHPWRPAGGTNGEDFSLFTQHDPNGKIVFLPEGQYDKSNFASMRRSDDAGGDEVYFEYLKTQLYASLEAAEPGKVNVFHFTIHPGEFSGNKQDQFRVIENFLTEVVDPLVASGDVQWVTLSEMADAFAEWELSQ